MIKFLDTLQKISGVDDILMKISFTLFLVGMIALLLVAFTLAILTEIKETCDSTRKLAGSGNATLASIQFVGLVIFVLAYAHYSKGKINMWVMAYLIAMIAGSFIQITTGGLVATDVSQKESADGLITTTSIMLIITGVFLGYMIFDIIKDTNVIVDVAERGMKMFNSLGNNIKMIFSNISQMSMSKSDPN